MPDITLCINEDCPLKDKCKRNSKHYEKLIHQSFTKFELKDGKCKYYKPIQKENKKI
jgi:hypothetical protein